MDFSNFAKNEPKKELSKFEQFKETPAYQVGLNVGLFALGVAFIQSSLMDLLAPQIWGIDHWTRKKEPNVLLIYYENGQEKHAGVL